MNAENFQQNKKQFIALGALVLVLGVVLYTQLFRSSGEPAVQARQNNPGGTNPMTSLENPDAEARVGSVFQKVDVDLDQLLNEVKVVEFNYAEEHIDRDPTRPLVGDRVLARARLAGLNEKQRAEDLMYVANRKNLTGIMWDEAKPLAVIDNEVVFEGYEFEEPIVVKAIARDHVILGLVGQDLEVVRELEEQ